MKKTIISIATALAIGVGVAVVIPALPAVSQSSPPTPAVQIGSPVTLDAKGAVARVPLRVICPAGVQIEAITVLLTERVGNQIAEGRFDGGRSTPCTGAFQTVPVLVAAFNKPYHHGTGFAQAFVVVCDQFVGCTFPSDARTVVISK